MGTATADVTFWSYNWYLMNNPHKQMFSRQDIHKAAMMFAATNSTELSATDPGGTYTDIEWPGSNGVTAVGNSSTHTEGEVLGATKTSIVDWENVDAASKVTLDQATWPESINHH